MEVNRRSLLREKRTVNALWPNEGAEVITLARQWVLGNYLRAAVGLAAWLAALRARSIPIL